MTYEVKDFDKEVIEESYRLPVVVDFWAPWCGPCQILGPVLENLAGRSNGDWILAKVNVDENQEVASEYRVRGIPAVKLFVDGEIAGEFTGAAPEIQVQKWLKENIPSENDKKSRNALELVRAGNEPKAKEIFEEIIADEPNHSMSAFHLAKLQIFDDPMRALELFTVAEKDPTFLDEARFVRKLAQLIRSRSDTEKYEDHPVKPVFLEGLNALAGKDFDLALEKFIEVVMKNKAYEDQVAKDACVAIFNYLGSDHDTTKRFRRRFDMALY